MGGGEVFRRALDLGEVDTISVTVIPVVLGDGTPLLPPPYKATKLKLRTHSVYKSGTLSLVYEIQP